MGKLVDLFGDQQGGLDFVMDHAMLCGGVIAFGGLATFLRLYLIETAIERISYRLRREFFGALLCRDIAFFDKHKTGELTTRLSNDITVTSRVLIDASAGIRSAISATVGTCMIFTLAPSEMMTGLLAPVAFLFAFGVGYGRLVRSIAEKRQDLLAKSVQLAEERLSGIRTVRTFNAEAKELAAFERMLDRVYVVGRQNAMAAGSFAAIFVAGGGTFLLHIIYNCGLMVTSGVVSIGTTISLGMYCILAGSSYTGLMTSYGDIQKAMGACQKVLQVLNEGGGAAAVVANAQNALPASSLLAESKPLAVRFEGVDFAYPARPDAPVLAGFDLDIPSGSRVALLGRSGSGKSTIGLLLAGLYAPSAGRVLVDGVDVFAEPGNAAWVRSQLGVISQEPTLFALSIRENVAYGLGGGLQDGNDGDAAGTAESSVQEASHLAHVHEFAEQLPEGFNTSAGERGQALSGGQKQRVCIARALARKPRMLVFDEATSALDLRSEELVHTALKEVLSSEASTCLVITHRLSALQWVDHVAAIHDGRVVQYGPRDAVLRDPCPELRAILRGDSLPGSMEEAPSRGSVEAPSATPSEAS